MESQYGNSRISTKSKLAGKNGLQAISWMPRDYAVHEQSGWSGRREGVRVNRTKRIFDLVFIQPWRGAFLAIP
jgi:hypothetical protein